MKRCARTSCGLPPSTPAARRRRGRSLPARWSCRAARGASRSRRGGAREGPQPRRHRTILSPERRARVAFNVQAFRVAVNKHTGAIKNPAQRAMAADAGRVMNPMQCRGQVEGGVAQSLGAALYQEMVIDDTGRGINPHASCNYHLPQFTAICADRSLVCRHLQFHRPIRRQVDEREPLQPGQRRDRKRSGQRDRHPVLADAVQARPDISGHSGQIRHVGLMASGVH